MKKKGFMLVEIMIVVAILSCLAAIAIPNLKRASFNANLKREYGLSIQDLEKIGLESSYDIDKAREILDFGWIKVTTTEKVAFAPVIILCPYCQATLEKGRDF